MKFDVVPPIAANAVHTIAVDTTAGPVPALGLTAARAKSPAVAYQVGRIGSRLERVRSKLLGIACDLAPRLDGLAQPLLTESRRVLERRTCRIAVIGQIKAGKSTFINALAGRPGLLPADINPWTAVVTLLQFRDQAERPSPAVRFQLFSASEWGNLAEGAGRLRELTKQLIPDFQADLLRAQFAVMRGRAERRLGSSFDDLLGQVHSYDDITRDLLTDYISAGDDFASPQTMPPRTCYSDVTRTAELYFSEGPFAFPVTLIDTPGINDPFLVRDEITRRSLENPDIFIFVISAVQPLTSADIAMLRLINGLHKDRILVFINRMDQLADPVNDGAIVKQRVEMRLAAEFPALEIPVILGSAIWANLSLQGHLLDVHAVSRILTPSVMAAAGFAPLARPSHAPVTAAERAHMAHALHVAAGMKSVSQTVDRLMGMSASSAILSHIGACLLELTKGKEVALRMEISSLSGLLQSRQAETAALQTRIGEERQALADLDARAIEFHRVLDDVERHLGDIVTAKMGPLHRELQTIVKAFANAQSVAMERSLRRTNPVKTWVCDVMPLREQLEDCYVRLCQSLGAELEGITREIQPVLRHAVDTLVPGSGRDFDEGPRPQTKHRPSVQPLRQTVVLDLSVSWWKAWFAARPDLEERADQLRTLIEGDFNPIADELIREAESYFGWYVAHHLDKARAIAESILATVRQRNEEIVFEFENWQRNGQQSGVEDFDARQCRRAVEVSAQRARLVSDIEELNDLLALLNDVNETQN